MRPAARRRVQPLCFGTAALSAEPKGACMRARKRLTAAAAAAGAVIASGSAGGAGRPGPAEWAAVLSQSLQQVVDDCFDRARQRGHQPVRHLRGTAQLWPPPCGQRADQQLQREIEPAGDRHHDRSDLTQRSSDAVRPLSRQASYRRVPWRRRFDYGTGGAARRLGRRGSAPSSNGMAATAKAGCLIVLNRWGHPVETLSGHGINGPWDSTAVSHGNVADLFVTNVLNGTVAAGGKVVHGGTVLRLTLVLHRHAMPQLVSSTKIGSGFAEQSSPTAFVLGPTGVGLGRHGILYVAETQSSRITGIKNALTRPGSGGTGSLVTKKGFVNMPLGLAIAPNGHILTVNGANGLVVETTPAGHQVARRLLDNAGSPKGAGALFGLAVRPSGRGVYYVDDAQNTLRLLH